MKKIQIFRRLLGAKCKSKFAVVEHYLQVQYIVRAKLCLWKPLKVYFITWKAFGVCSMCGPWRSHLYLCLYRDSYKWIKWSNVNSTEHCALHKHIHFARSHIAIILIILRNYDFCGRYERFFTLSFLRCASAAAKVSLFRTNSSTFDGWWLMAFQWYSIKFMIFYQVHRVQTSWLFSKYRVVL